MALEAKILANWQRGGRQAPLFPLILHWCVCQGDTLGLASVTCLFQTRFCYYQIGCFAPSSKIRAEGDVEWLLERLCSSDIQAFI